jgi:hypothetical protein
MRTCYWGLLRRARNQSFLAGALGLCAISLCASGAVWAAPGLPSAPTVSDGNYTVTPNGCNEYLPGQTCVAEWVEERAEPTGVFVATPGTFTNKPPGVYAYRTADMYCDDYYWVCTTRVGGAVTVTVGSLPPRDPLEAQQQYAFRARTGNLVGDSGTDILIERVTGGQVGNGVIDAVILQQTAGHGFAPIVPTAAQRTSTAWMLSGLEVAAEDINVDGYVDVIVKHVASAIPGAHDQIVYSPGFPLSDTAKGVRSLDEPMARFTGNMLDYMIDNDYFLDNAPLVEKLVTYVLPFCIDPYGDIGWGSVCFPIVYYDYAIVPDYSVFDPSAVDIWSAEYRFAEGSWSRATAVDRISSTVAGMLGVGLGGWDLDEVLGPSGPHDDPLWRKGLEAFIAIIGIGNAHADEVAQQSDKAPRQIERASDVIYITGRYVFGTGVNKLHSSVYYRVPGTSLPRWVSAFDTDDSILGDGKLIGRTNDLRDRPILMRFTLGTVIPPTGVTAYSHFFTNILPAHAHYRALPLSSLPDYDAIPELPPCGGCAGRNSNGYVHGLVSASGGRASALPPLNFNDLVGWEYPVERYYFGR